MKKILLITGITALIAVMIGVLFKCREDSVAK